MTWSVTFKANGCCMLSTDSCQNQQCFPEMPQVMSMWSGFKRLLQSEGSLSGMVALLSVPLGRAFVQKSQLVTWTVYLQKWSLPWEYYFNCIFSKWSHIVGGAGVDTLSVLELLTGTYDWHWWHVYVTENLGYQSWMPLSNLYMSSKPLSLPLSLCLTVHF